MNLPVCLPRSLHHRFAQRTPFLFLLIVGILLPASMQGRLAAAERKLEYNQDIRPILAENCFTCHGPDSAARKADLRLDVRENAIDMAAIEPGHPETSELISRILTDDSDLVMPPPSTKKTLTAAQKETLKKWVEQGAEYQLHWSFIAPVLPELPTVKNEAWVKTPIDRFILAELERRNLSPAPEADKRALARRVSLDLTGLPPTPELVERFVNSPDANAYEKLVDELLASPDWGEHRGRYWLDYSRYADTHGIHFDNYREMWSYREWVIKAFNRNMTFDQFTIENLAGDLLPDATLDQQIASGFNRCNMTTNEGGVIPEEYLVLYTRDRTETVAQVWMGLTAGCAVCHTHKFDPISHQEFYELAAFFNNTTQGAMDKNIKDTPPVVVVPTEADFQRWNQLGGEIASTKQEQQKRRETVQPEFVKWMDATDPLTLAARTQQSENLHLHARLNVQETETQIILENQEHVVAVSETAEWQPGPTGEQDRAIQISKGAVVEIPDAGDFDSDQPFTLSAWIKTPANDGSGAIVARMDPAHEHRGWDLWIEGRRIATHIIHSWPENALKVSTRNQLPANKWVHVTVTYNGSKKGNGVKFYFDGVEQERNNVVADKLKDTSRTTVPLKIGQRNNGTPAVGVAIQDLKIYRQALASETILLQSRSRLFADLIGKPAAERDAKLQEELFQWWLKTEDAPWIEITGRLTALEKEDAGIRARGTVAHIMQEKPEPAMAFILNRGEYDQRLDQVTPNTPAVLPPFPEEVPRNRLTFAQWLLQPDQPLTSRVTVNRFWQEVFGTGIVASSGDFGIMGELPSHPELLDWLALDFMQNSWDVKRFFKQIVMSSTYRQSAVTTPEKQAQDPENLWVSRGPRFRMDAEMVRDSALAATGALVREIGGPSVKPYQPEGVWEVVGMPGSTTRNYKQDTGNALYRRSLYTFIKRMAPPPSMEIFNAPNREFCVIRRERTNTPLQALVTLNDEQFVEAARILAQRVIHESGPDVNSRLDLIARHLLSRPFRPEEVEIVTKSLEGIQNYYGQAPDDATKLIHFGSTPPDETIPPTELAAWTMLVNQLMNLDEVLNK
ncbi:MAG TPA: DUF1553 domain-containing protein [Planctomicrobium sp.]|nr:DUF1553 domain-containing protein [Planctomicrobium sp.]